MVYETRKQSMAWMQTDYSKHTYFRWKVKWRLEHLGALGVMGETAFIKEGEKNVPKFSWEVFVYTRLSFKELEVDI